MKTRITSILVALALLVSGCPTTPGTQKSMAKLAVQIAVIKVAANNPEKAARVASIAKAVKEIAGDENANTVDLLVAIARAKVDKLNLANEDRILANGLIDLVGEELKAKLGEGVLTSDKLLFVGEVAGWIIDTAAIVRTAPVTG
jgi:predicted small secreted protein/molybdopterin converting factor small subunit